MTVLYLDSETPPIDRAKLAQRPVCVQSAIADGPVAVQLWRDYTPDLTGTIVGANIAYDMACLMAGNPRLTPAIFAAYDQGRVVDVQLDGKLLDIAAGEYTFRSKRGWNLQELARRAGLRIDKDEDDETGNGSWRLRFAALDGVPVDHWPEGALEYAAGDVTATRVVHRWQQARRAEWIARGVDPLAPAHSAHAAYSAFCLHLMSCHGVLTDPASVGYIKARLEVYLAAIGKRLVRAKLVRADGTKDTKAAARVTVNLCAKKGREIVHTDGADKTEAKAKEKYAALVAHVPTGRGATAHALKLAKLTASWHRGIFLPGVKVDKDQAILLGSRVLELYAEYASADLLRGRVERLAKGYVLPLQARFDALKETTRTSSSQPAEPLVGDQLQNHARASGVTASEKKRERGFKDRHGVVHKPEFFVGLRECFRPRDGYTFGIADFSMAELHSLSEVCTKLFGHSEMARLLLAGVDLHIHFGMRSRGLKYEDFDKVTMGLDRDRAKPANFGFPGGMGPDSFILYARKSYGVRFEREEVVQLKRQWLETFPEVKAYLDWISRYKGDADVFTLVHPITGFVRGGCYYASAANNGFQHLTAMGAKAALCAVTRACFDPASPLWGSRPWNFVHDEIVIESPLDRAHEAALEMGRLMDQAFNHYHPNVPTHAEPLLADRWSKKAKPVLVDGRLAPWTLPAVAA